MNKHKQNEKKTHLCVVDASRPVKRLAINGLEAWQTDEVYNLVPKKKLIRTQIQTCLKYEFQN